MFSNLFVYGSKFFISLLRDHVSEAVFLNLVLTGTYLGIVILILIGYLFRRVILFTNEDFLWEIKRKELLLEAKIRLRENLFHKYSNQFLRREFDELGVQVFTALDLFVLEQTSDSEREMLKKEYYIEDINLSILNKEIESFKNSLGSSEKVFLDDISLGHFISKQEKLLWTNDKRKEYLTCTHCFSFSKKRKNIKQNDFVNLSYLNQRYMELIQTGNKKDLVRLHELFISLYNLKMDVDNENV